MRHPCFRSLFVALCAVAATPAGALETASPKPRAPEGVTFHEAATQVLIRSDKPRDWVLAAQLSVGRAITDESRSPQAMLRRAATAAPNDAVVQWIWANNHILAGNPEDRSASLRKLEPDNAAAWTFELAQVVARKDEPGIDAALKHMAAAKRDDVHWVDTTLAWTEALTRVLSNADVRAAAKRMNPSLPPEVLATDLAVALSGAFATPPYPPLSRACDAKATPAPSDARKADCVTVGRLMLSRGSTILTQRTGANLLRKLGALGADDQRQLREIQWVMAQYNTMSAHRAAKTNEPSSELKEWTLDHKAGDREIDSWQRRLERHGLARTPPDDWVSPRESRDAAKAAREQAASEKQ